MARSVGLLAWPGQPGSLHDQVSWAPCMTRSGGFFVGPGQPDFLHRLVSRVLFMARSAGFLARHFGRVLCTGGMAGFLLDRPRSLHSRSARFLAGQVDRVP